MNLLEQLKATIKDVPDFPKPGIVFKDITPLFLDADLSRKIAEELANNIRPFQPDAIAALESRGFLFGRAIAEQLNIPLILIRKKGKLPRKTVQQSYDLEYGSATIELHEEDLPKGSKVVIHDDLLATGGTAEAAASLIEKVGSQVVGFSFIITLDFLNGKNRLLPFTENIDTLVRY